MSIKQAVAGLFFWPMSACWYVSVYLCVRENIACRGCSELMYRLFAANNMIRSSQVKSESLVSSEES